MIIEFPSCSFCGECGALFIYKCRQCGKLTCNRCKRGSDEKGNCVHIPYDPVENDNWEFINSMLSN